MRGQSANFTCHVNLENALAKYLKFKWYKEEDNGFVEIPSYERYRHDDSSSVLMIRNAKATPRGSILYKCEISYKGRTSFSRGPLVMVQSKLGSNYRIQGHSEPAYANWLESFFERGR